MGLSLTTMVLIGLIVLLAAGLALMLWGLIGRRVGDEPRCCKCKYNLTGLEGDKCPECGRPATDKNVRIGLRKRRRTALIIGSLLLLTGLSGFGSVAYVRARSINWYQYAPTFAVIRQAQLDEIPAIQELTRRVATKGFDGSKVRVLVPLALQQQGRDPRPRSIYAWVDFLASMEFARLLSPPQQERFYAQIATFQFKYRPTIRQGEELKISFEHWTMGSTRLIGSFQIEDGVLQIGDWIQDYHYLGGDSLARCGGGALGFTIPTDAFGPGQYDVELRANMNFTSPSFTRAIVETGSLEILPPEATSTVRLIDNPQFATQLKRIISVETTDRPWGGQPEPGKFYFEIAIKGDVPVDCVFDAYARTTAGEHKLTTLIIKKGQGADSRHQASCDRAQIDSDSFIPVLRTSESAATDTPDMFEIWDGELVFDPVPIVQPTLQPAGALDEPSGATSPPSQADAPPLTDRQP